MERSIFEEIKAEMYKAAKAVNDYADQKDLKRNCVNYGSLITWDRIIRQMGHDTNIAVWEVEGGYLRIPLVEIETYRMEFENGKYEE